MKLTDNSIVGSIEEFKAEFPAIHKRLIDVSIGELVKRDDILLFPEDLGDVRDFKRTSKILETRDNMVFTSNLVGFFGAGDETMILKSRFSDNSHDYFLHYLLKKVLSINIVDLEIGIAFDENIYNILEYSFPKYLNRALKKGMYKEYKRFDYNDLSVRGKIEVSRHISLNTPFKGSIAYSTKEFSFDNDITQLIRHTIEFLKTLPDFNQDLMITNKTIKENIEWIRGVTPSYKLSNRLKIISRNMNKSVVHAYFCEYKTLQKICLMILTGGRHGIQRDNKKINGIIFDVAWLWEEYLNILIGNSFIHPQNKSQKMKQYLFKTNNKFVGPIYPDFVGINEFSDIIADAKYKPFNNIQSTDYHQILSYMYRFQRKVGLFLHPRRGENDAQKSIDLFLLSGLNDDLYNRESKEKVSKIGFSIPQNPVSSFEEYSELMMIEEGRFMNELGGFVD